MKASRQIDLDRIEIVDDASVEMFRAMSGAQKLKLASDMFTSARRMLRHSLIAEHPDWTEEKLQAEVLRRISHD